MIWIRNNWPTLALVIGATLGAITSNLWPVAAGSLVFGIGEGWRHK